MDKFLIIGMGGALGAICRYSISLIPTKSIFPILTLLTNFTGAIAIGIIAGLFANGIIAKQWTLFWQTGVCGGFTTFSTFSLEAWLLIENKNFIAAGLYIFASVALCLLGVVIGLQISQALQRT